MYHLKNKDFNFVGFGVQLRMHLGLVIVRVALTSLPHRLWCQ